MFGIRKASLYLMRRVSLKKFPYIAQHDTMDCGPACLTMIANYYNKKYSLQEIREYCYLARDGVSLLGIEDGARKIGFETIAVKINTSEIINRQPLPCILYWNNNHFVVLYKVSKSLFSPQWYFYIMDPDYGKIVLNQTEFESYWLSESGGIALLLNPSNSFYEKGVTSNNEIKLSYFFKFIKPNKKEFFTLFWGLFFSSILNLIFPFLTQALVDLGINSKNLHYISIILLSQLFLFFGITIIDIVRNWELVFINSKINISVISNFLNKIINLPFKFFDAKQLGDFSTRIGDHQRIEEFLTSQSLMVLFSSLNFIVFFFVLLFYNNTILLVYLSITILSIVWAFYFLKKIKDIDYRRFKLQSETNQSIFELVNGIVEIKLNSIEDYKISLWKNKQVKLFNVNLNSLKLDQFQLIGFEFFNQLKNILVVFMASREVVFGNMTLGTLLSISYIIGMMNAPLNQLIAFLRSWQFAKLSFERLNEVQNMQNEDTEEKVKLSIINHHTTKRQSIKIANLSFHYYGPRSPKVLNNINLVIPKEKTTAIVGESGSGKTTLIKLLLKFYEPSTGQIFFGDYNLNDISAKDLRYNCGVVMQDGYIFSDTLERNIATGSENIDKANLSKAIKIANLHGFINSLPQKLNTMLGSGGNGVSGGEKQRILIARAVYKNPHYIFFDEATSSLDAENEKIIYDNLEEFLKRKTVIKIAHRLSTVKNADQIIVLKKGEIVEIGNHKKLIDNKGVYFNLVKNQLELSV